MAGNSALARTVRVRPITVFTRSSAEQYPVCHVSPHPGLRLEVATPDRPWDRVTTRIMTLGMESSTYPRIQSNGDVPHHLSKSSVALLKGSTFQGHALCGLSSMTWTASFQGSFFGWPLGE